MGAASSLIGADPTAGPDARRAARTTATGELVPLGEQDRSLWNADDIAEGVALITQVLPRETTGPTNSRPRYSPVFLAGQDQFIGGRPRGAVRRPVVILALGRS